MYINEFSLEIPGRPGQQVATNDEGRGANDDSPALPFAYLRVKTRSQTP